MSKNTKIDEIFVPIHSYKEMIWQFLYLQSVETVLVIILCNDILSMSYILHFTSNKSIWTKNLSSRLSVFWRILLTKKLKWVWFASTIYLHKFESKMEKLHILAHFPLLGHLDNVLSKILIPFTKMSISNHLEYFMLYLP